MIHLCISSRVTGFELFERFTMATKRVAVVGGGMSGLVAIKCCLDEGLEPVCFEQHDDIGGIWNYTEHPRPNQGAASFKNLITNTSKETMAFSDFPMPEHYPQYMSHSQFMEYLRSYAEHFDLIKHINFRTKVVNITKAEDYSFTGCWQVHTEGEVHAVVSKVYDAVLICTGAANSPYFPDIDGMYTDYKGQIAHMHSYRTHYEFKDKTVLVVGNQNSAGDAAADISHAAKQVYWSVGKGTTVFSRFSEGNVPIDLRINRFLLSTLFPYIPGGSRTIAKTFKEKRAEALIKHQQYGLTTKDSLLPFNGGAMLVNEELKYKIMSGRVKCKSNLIQLYNQKAEFSDGTSVDDIDVVFFATGYNLDLSYVDDRIIQGLGRDRTTWPVYKWVFPIDLQHSTLALIALTPVGGPVPPLVEIHCRWATSVIAGKRKLPPKEEMERYQMEKQKLYQQRSGGRFQPILLHLLEDLAEELDANPSFWKLCKYSPLFAVKAQFGPVVSALYRIVGYGALPDGIKNYKNICYRAFNTPNYQSNYERTVSQQKGTFPTRYLVFGVLIVALLWMWKLCG